MDFIDKLELPFKLFHPKAEQNIKESLFFR